MVRGVSTCVCVVCAVVGLLVAHSLAADEIAFDDFEDVQLVPFDLANEPEPGWGDGTDWTNVIPGWIIENTPDHVAIDADAYNGWTALDVDSWINQQGNQEGRIRMRLGVDNNTALVADPDAWDDFMPGNEIVTGYNSYIRRTYDLTDVDLETLALSFDWDFVAESYQIATFEISFDGGNTYDLIFAIASKNWLGDPVWGGFAVAKDDLKWSTNPEGYTVEPTQKTFLAGVDFVPPADATSMTLRFGCILSGNDWWFAVDNVQLEDVGGVIEFEDFEGLDLRRFADGGVDREPVPPPGDGTDYSQDIPSWTIDNDGSWDPELRMYTRSMERAFDGWAVLDAVSWLNEQGGQLREEFFPNPLIFAQRNTVLVADPDAHDDYDVELPDDDPNKSKKEFNSFIYRTYDVSNYDNTTIRVELEWETRIESQQRALIQASFDMGATWVDLLDVDSADPTKLATLSDFVFVDEGDPGVVDEGDLLNTFEGPQAWQFGDAFNALPAKHGSSMILRLGCINAENNWWFAVDNILIEGDPQSFKHGDADQNGSINFGDLSAFILALNNKAAYDSTYSIPADTILDMSADGVFNFGDIAGFLGLFN